MYQKGTVMPSEPVPQLRKSDESSFYLNTKQLTLLRNEGWEEQQHSSKAKLCYLSSAFTYHLNKEKA
jgi:hypothetical protein